MSPGKSFHEARERLGLREGAHNRVLEAAGKAAEFSAFRCASDGAIQSTLFSRPFSVQPALEGR